MRPISHKAILKYYQNPHEENSVCSFTISVGQPSHEGDKLYAALNSAAGRFNGGIIMVCDLLQRHTLAAQYDEQPTVSAADRFSELSRSEGQLWYRRNKHLIDSMGMPCKVVFWEHWLELPLYQTHKEMLFQHYKENREFSDAMDKTIETFYQRVVKRSPGISYDNFFYHSFNYLIEECAVQLLWAEHEINFEIYPSERNEVLSCCYNQFIAPVYADRLKPVSIKFKRISESRRLPEVA